MPSEQVYYGYRECCFCHSVLFPQVARCTCTEAVAAWKKRDAEEAAEVAAERNKEEQMRDSLAGSYLG